MRGIPLEEVPEMTKALLAAMLVASLTVFVGCGKDEPAPDKKAEKDKPKDGKDEMDPNRSHGDWWCDEHGVKEAECSICNKTKGKALQAKGDWCKEHARAKSQCFICDPTLRAKFAEEYVAKYGKQPPEPTENMPPKK